MRLTCTEGGSDKFWEGRVEGSTLTVTFGKTGTAGQTKTKDLASAADAEKELAKLVREKRAKGYVDDGAAGASPPAPPSPASPASSPSPRPFPFLFFGRRPADWFEGPKEYEIRFVAPPPSSLRARLVDELAPQLEDTGNLAWADTHAWLFLRETPPVPEGGFDRLFERAEWILTAIHRVMPIDQVVLRTERAPGTHAWDVWTRSERAKPLAGPPSSEGRSDPAFDEAIAKANAARRSAAAAKTAAKGGIAAVGTELRLDPLGKRFPQPERPYRGSSGHVAVLTPPLALRVVAPDGTVTQLPDAPPGVRSMAVSDDGTRALFVLPAHPYGAVVERELLTGTTRHVYSPEAVDDRIGPACAVAYAAGGMIGVLTSEHLYLVELATSRCEYFERTGGPQVFPALGGRVLCVLGGDKVQVVGVAGAQSKMLGKVKLDAWAGGEVDGHIVFEGRGGHHELVNVEPAWQAFAAKAGKKAKPRS